MKKYYYNTLDKNSQKQIIQQYKKDYAKSDFANRIKRLFYYSIISYALAIVLLTYAFKTQDDIIGNTILSVSLIIMATIFLFGRHVALIRMLNKIALDKKKSS